MNILNWLQANGPVITLVATVVLVVITAIYVYLTKKILDSTVRQSNLAFNPVIGIRLGKIVVSKTFGPSRRNLHVGLNLTNVGNAPAIEVLVDAEIILQYSNIRGEKVIPARFEASSISYIRPGEDITEDGNPDHNPSFGNTCITHLLDDFRECNRLNIHRIETDPTKESYKASMLKAVVYYRNNLGQYFESTYETYLAMEKIPEDEETAELHQIYIPRHNFHTDPISKATMDKDMSSRNIKRELCGW